MTHYKGIIFDLDGTLADTLDDIADSMNAVLLTYGFPIRPVNEYKLLVGRGLDNLVKQALPGNHRNTGFVNQCLDEMMDHYTRNCLVKTHLYKGISELLLHLQGQKISCSVFSNKTEPLTIKIVRHLLPDFPFVTIAGARPDVPKKPDPAGALLVAGKMNLLPEEIIYVGDSDVDMLTANTAMMYPVGVSWGFRSREELLENGAGVILEKPSDLVKVLV